MSPWRYSLNSAKEFKMKKEYALLESEAIMAESLKMGAFIYSMKKMEFFIISPLLECLNKTVLLRERVDHYKKWLGPCSMITLHLNIYRLKQ